jgi:hypothetical protein
LTVIFDFNDRAVAILKDVSDNGDRIRSSCNFSISAALIGFLKTVALANKFITLSEIAAGISE